jgi:hypothetical protein
MKKPLQFAFWRSKSNRGSEEEELVEFSEYVLVLSPTSLWEQWKTPHSTQAQPTSTHNTQVRNATSAAQIIDEPLVSGTYTTLRDNGLTYDYEVFWKSIGDMAIWYSRVTRDGIPKGRPSGTVDLAPLSDIETQVKRVVELRIEAL